MGVYMKARDGISGKEGIVTANINGTVKVVAECKSINAKITKNKQEFHALGYRGTQYKAKGWTGTGTLVIHYASSDWIRQMIAYANTGIDTYFNLTITNMDPTSAIGSQTVMLMDCNLDESEIVKLDVEADFLDQSMNFTFSGVILMESFSPLITGVSN